MVRMVVHTLISRLLLFFLMGIFFVPAAIFFMLPRKIRYESKLFFWCADLFYRASLKILFLPIRYIGIENVPDYPVIFAANHQSSLDIPLIGTLARGKAHVWLALADLMSSPILSFVLPRVSVLVDTKTSWKAVKSLLQIMDLVKEHNAHIMIFPEGGRFVDGKVHDFFGGFAILARRTNRPVIPVCISGVREAYPPSAFLIRRQQITVTIGSPFVIRENEDDESFKNRVHNWFIDQAKEQIA